MSPKGTVIQKIFFIFFNFISANDQIVKKDKLSQRLYPFQFWNAFGVIILLQWLYREGRAT